ncbi:ABC transporter substrate-binding protein [Paenibacillus alba]|uniref:Extracellular solute-binding protein n=1 Tax=Paenibacillus alba TaxID=1197127 RepID=A0ABU6GFS7_9BACL|nr:extracellular solute-binding protein [Paenibacillus alba]MEC0231598.1 extracellular solute-binding protein [Paenibacillus alba]
MKNKLLVFLKAILLVVICTSCSSTPESSKLEGKVKILYYNEELFNEEYGDLLSSNFKNLEFEVISIKKMVRNAKNPENEIVQFIRDEKPDVIFVRSYDEYLEYIEKGLLMDLDPWIRKDKLDIENMQKGIISILRDKEKGSIFGLAPTFSSNVIYYNKQLFSTYGVDYPHDQMTWEEIFHLSKRFNGNDKGIYGFSTVYSPYDLLNMLGRTNGLSILHKNQSAPLEVMSDSAAWGNLLDSLAEVYRSNTVYYCIC